MIFVARETILACHASGVTGLAKIFFHRSKIRYERLRVPLFVAFQIGSGFFEPMAGEAAAVFHYAKMWLMNEMREAALFALGGRRREVDESPFPLDIVQAVAFRA
jgi:hypothetical protein